MMTVEERQHLVLLADALDVQIEELIGRDHSRELNLALERLEEASMWIRRAVERMK